MAGLLEPTAEYAAPLRFAYITGWRFHSEMLALTADRAELDRGTVRLDAGKNGTPRVFVLTKDAPRARRAAGKH